MQKQICASDNYADVVLLMVSQLERCQ